MTADSLPLTAQRSTSDRAQLAAIIGVSLAVRVGYLLFKPSSVVSLDVGMWQRAAEVMMNGGNPYLIGSQNFLPLWPTLIWGMAWLSRWTGWAFTTFLWPLLIAFETGIIAAAFGLLRRSVSAPSARNILLIAIVLNPAAMFQVTQHGNIDVLFMLWVMLAIAAMIRFHEQGRPYDWTAACAWIGLGILTKTAPVALVPLLAAGASKLSRRTLVKGLLLLFGPPLLGFAIIFPFAPADVWRNVVRYRSVHGYFGLSGFMGMIDGVEFPQMGPMLRLQAMLFNIGLPICMFVIALRMWWGGWKHSAQIPLATALIFVSILIFGTGFGPQHIYWLIPPLAVSWGMIPNQRWRRLLIFGWLVIAITYMFEYLILSSHGELLRTLYPQSELLYRISLRWLTPADQTIMRLPLFCVFVAILVQGIRELKGMNEATQPSISAAV